MSVLLTLLALTASGIPMAAALDRSGSRTVVCATAPLYGVGVLAVVMTTLSVCGVPWRLPVIVAIQLALCGLSLFVVSRRAAPGSATATPASTPLSVLIDVLTLTLLSGYTLYWTLARPWEWDYWAIWGLKGRLFFLRGAIDFSWLRNPLNTFAHPDYPPLLPELYSFLAMAQGEWDDRWFGLTGPLFAVAALLLVRAVVAEDAGSSTVGALAALCATGGAMTATVGMAEGALTTFATIGVLLMRRDLAHDHPSLAGPLMLGFAALTKNEGLSFVIAATLALLLVYWRSPRRVLRMWPAWMLAGAWQVVRLSAGLHTDLFEGEVAARALSAAERIEAVLRAIAERPSDMPLFWFAALLAVVLRWRLALDRERFILSVIVLQVTAYVVSYLVTPHDIGWHVFNSWIRVLNQTAVLVAVLGIALVLRHEMPTLKGSSQT